MGGPLDNLFQDWLEAAESRHRRRRLRPVEPAGAGRVRVGDRTLVDFSSNDYLGLRHHPALLARSRAWTERFGAGSGGSRLVTGNLSAAEDLEARLADLKGAEAALILPSGFQANASVLPALLDRRVLGAEPQVFVDRLVHASIHHGLAAAGVRQIRFRHNDLSHLARLLEDADQARPRFVVTESVFSMDGDVADVPGLSALCEVHQAFLYLDEAHATGVLGPQGRGLGHGLGGSRGLVMGTFGKALGAFGAFVACSRMVREYLVNQAGGFVFATALPPGTLGAVDAALDLLPDLDEARARVDAHARRARAALAAAGLDTGASSTPIVPLVVGDETAALALAADLEREGILAVAIRPPTVPPGTSRLRFAFSAAHSDDDVDRLLDLLTGPLRPCPL